MVPVFEFLNSREKKSIKTYYLFFVVSCFLFSISLQAEINNNHNFIDVSEIQSIEQQQKFRGDQPKKKWTVLVYMAADNDLYPFAYRNLAQMKQVGSNENVNILIHLDISHAGQPKVTKHIYMERDKVWQIGPDYLMDSGSDITLFDSVKWALDDFPSDHIAIILWNHGSGDLNPVLRKTINPAQLFKYNTKTHLIELNRTIGFMDFVEKLSQNHQIESLETPATSHPTRGICFDETNGTYLDDAKLMRAFEKIIKERNNKKIDLIIFDACLMAGTGTAYIMSHFADYMVASEEVVLGAGYDYQIMLKKLIETSEISPEDFAKSIVKNYEITYGKQTNDYTNSALKLEYFDALNKNIDLLAQLLIEAIKYQSNNSVKLLIKKCRSRNQCAFFDEPSYIDLGNFYENLLKNINQIILINNKETANTIQAITKTLQQGLFLINKLIIANVVGKNLARARGISIHFPEYYMESPSFQSYYSTEFAKNNSWAKFLKHYFH